MIVGSTAEVLKLWVMTHRSSDKVKEREAAVTYIHGDHTSLIYPNNIAVRCALTLTLSQK